MNLKSVLPRALALATAGVLTIAPPCRMGDPGSGHRPSFNLAEGLNLNSGAIKNGAPTALIHDLDYR
jgi:hypothetical protein